MIGNNFNYFDAVATPNKRIDAQIRSNRYKVTDEKLASLLQQSIAEVQVFYGIEMMVSYLLPCGIIIFGRTPATVQLGSEVLEAAGRNLCEQDAMNQLRRLEGYRAQYRWYVDSQNLEEPAGVPKHLTNSQIESLLENAIAQTRYCHNRGAMVSYLLPCGFTITGVSRVAFASFDTMDAVHECYADALAQLRELEDYRLSWDIYLYHLQVIVDAGRKRML